MKKKPLPPIIFNRRPVVLTDREQDVLRRFAEGFTHQEIAEQLGIATPTVSSYLQRVKDKYRIKTRAALVAVALELGLI